MEETLRALGPYPFLQLMFGMVILGLGIWSIIKGLQAKESPEEQRAQWEARQQLENLESNSWKIVALLEKHNELLVRQNELMGRLASVLYNDQRLPR